MLKQLYEIGSRAQFHKLLKQKFLLNTFLLSKIKQDTSYILYMVNGILAGDLILVSIVLLCLATFCAWAAL